MNIAHHIRQRSSFLALKAKVLGLSAAEQNELDRLQTIRIHQSPWAVVIEPHPMSMDEWKAQVAKSRAAPVKLVADAGTDKPQT